METIEWLLPAEFRYALGWLIIHSIWQIALVGLLLWLSQRLFANRSILFHHRMGLAGLLMIVFLAAGTYWVSFSTPSASGFMTPSPPAKSMVALSSSQVTPTPTLLDSLLSSLELSIPILVKGWLFGALLFFIRFATSLADIRVLKNKPKSEMDAKWVAMMEEQMKKLGIKSPVQLFQSVHVGLPLTYGIWKPVILIPASLVLQLSPAQLEAILTHELAHIKRYDYAVNLIQCWLEVIFFYHPVFWWINYTIRESRESVADDTAINNGICPTDLAFGLANTLNHSTSPSPDMAMASTGKKTPTLTRIKRIMGYKTHYSQPTPLSSLSMLAAILLGATLLVGASSSPEPKPLKPLDSNILQLRQQLFLKPFEGFQRSDQDSDSVPTNSNSLPLSLDSLLLTDLVQDDLEAIEFEIMEAMKPYGSFSITGLDSVPVFDWTTPPFPDFDFYMDMPTPPAIDFDTSFELNLDDLPVVPDFFPGIHFPDSFPFSGFAGKGISKDSLKILEEQFKIKQQEWQQKFDEKHQGWQEKFQEKMTVWEEQNKPKLEAFQQKMEEWQMKNQPKMEEFQLKMEKWQEENEVKMKEKMAEFEVKMEEWQQKHQKQLEKAREKRDNSKEW